MITFIPLTGFLGAGKTTTMTATALALQETGRKVAVITNDQGVELVDTKLVRSKLGSVAEVTGGCFCCKFEDLVEAVVALVDSDGVDVVIAEAVGSCTDLQATVVRPLRQYYGDSMVVAPSPRSSTRCATWPSSARPSEPNRNRTSPTCSASSSPKPTSSPSTNSTPSRRHGPRLC